jgi:hypothetical protein
LGLGFRVEGFRFRVRVRARARVKMRIRFRVGYLFRGRRGGHHA